MCKKLHRYVAKVIVPVEQGGGMFKTKSRAAALTWRDRGCEVVWLV